MSELYADVAVPIAVEMLFTYIVPEEFRETLRCGVRVVVPFGRRTVVGFVVDIKPSPSSEAGSQSGTWLAGASGKKIRNLKSILDVLDAEPLLSDELLRLVRWISEYYFAPIGEVLKAVHAQGAARLGKRIARFNGVDADSILRILTAKPKQAAIIRELASNKRMSVASLRTKLRSNSIYAPLNELARQGYVVIEEEAPGQKMKPKYETIVEVSEERKSAWRDWLSSAEPAKRLARQVAAVQEFLKIEVGAVQVTQFLKISGSSLSTLRLLEKKNLLTIDRRVVVRTTEYDLYASSLGSRNIVLNSDQKSAIDGICQSLTRCAFHTFLLYGVTGSGKTQVYIEVIREALRQGNSAIVLVPEISLTPQIVRRFKQHFGDRVASIHSRMSPGERHDVWQMIRDGTCSIVIGPRSAVFAPFKNLGLIVVDEEQEPSYKQFDQSPRYHARDVAIMRASFSNAVVVLGSATPSFESYANAMNGKYTLIELPERADNAKLPEIEIVDMTEERRRKLLLFRGERKHEFAFNPLRAKLAKHPFEISPISDLLRDKISDRLHKREGIILLQNRRGFSAFVECPDCGYVEMCANCNISLTYHLTQKHLRCHYCGTVKQPPAVCPKCDSPDVQYRGFGTQRVEEEIEKLFPGVAMIRMDLDTTTRRGSHDAILKKFSEGEVDILLGTQMVAKGLDFSRVTLVGVISADTQMLLPDFRSSERTFQLLTQVAGRAGRSTLAGEVVIQTYQPLHDSLKHVATHDYRGFYEQEITFRKELDYPPYSRIVMLELRGEHETEVRRNAMELAELLRRTKPHLAMLGPATAAIGKLKGLYRWHIVIKDLKETDPSGQRIQRTLRGVLQSYKAYKTSGSGKNRSVRLIIDIDPVGMM